MKAYITAFLLMVFPLVAKADISQTNQDVFIPIGKYIKSGDSESLAAWFAPSIELDLLGKVSECSRAQAVRILHDFFHEYTPKSFYVLHKSGRAPMKYAIAHLDAGGDKFRISIFVKIEDDGNYIQQIRIEHE